MLQKRAKNDVAFDIEDDKNEQKTVNCQKVGLDENKKRTDNIIKRRLFGGKYETIVTISRQYGSGGRFIGRLLADELGIPFYDKEIIAQASENSGFAQEFIKENEQK